MEASECRENMMPRPTALSTNPFGSAGMPGKLTLAAVGHTAVNVRAPHSKEEARTEDKNDKRRLRNGQHVNSRGKIICVPIASIFKWVNDDDSEDGTKTGSAEQSPLLVQRLEKFPVFSGQMTRK
jgi:hypothetical protein